MATTQCKQFPYKGRIILSCPAAEDAKSTIVGYKSSAAEVARIKQQWGPESVNEEKGIVNLVAYINNDKNNRQDFAGAFDNKPGEGGISNIALLGQINNDPNFYRQATGNPTANTTPVNPNQQNTQGGESSAPTTAPSTTPATPKSALVYPLDMANTKQDRIKFTAVEYLPSGDLSSQKITFPDRKKVRKSIKDGSVFLPIQSSITDQNSVDWQGGNLNELERFLVNASLGGMKNKTLEEIEKGGGAALGTAISSLRKYENEAKVYLASQAVGIQSLLGKFGTVLNPNLELLFTGPQLRPFEFQFKMSAREQKEANTIKEIIKFFKKNMAPKGKSGEVFLRSPYTFFIEYQYGNPDPKIKDLTEHPGINKIKECALLNCAVDYTPNGTYMTYQDGTMVSYTLSLSFQELEPIYSGDYDGHAIGY